MFSDMRFPLIFLACIAPHDKDAMDVESFIMIAQRDIAIVSCLRKVHKRNQKKHILRSRWRPKFSLGVPQDPIVNMFYLLMHFYDLFLIAIRAQIEVYRYKVEKMLSVIEAFHPLSESRHYPTFLRKIHPETIMTITCSCHFETHSWKTD